MKVRNFLASVLVVGLLVSASLANAATREIQCSTNKAKQGSKTVTLSLVIGNCGTISDCSVVGTVSGRSTRYSRVKRSAPSKGKRTYTKSGLSFKVDAQATNGLRAAGGTIVVNKKTITFSKAPCQVVDVA